MQVATPVFFETPEAVWVKCASHQILPTNEVACAVTRVDGRERVIMILSRFFDAKQERVEGIVIANVEDGRLVDFPSGDRIAVPSDVVEARE